MKWLANKRKISKQELEEKFDLLNTLHNQTFPNLVAIKNLEKEIDYWSEQEDMK